jgi:hypothetical protein
VGGALGGEKTHFLLFWVGVGALQTRIFVCFRVSGGVLRLGFVVDFFKFFNFSLDLF